MTAAPRGRVIALSVGLLVVGALLCAAWVGSRVLVAAGHLERAAAIAADVPGMLVGESERMPAAVERLSAEAAAARSATDDPLWRLAEALPWAGPQLAAVGTLSAGLDDLAGVARVALADASVSLDPTVFLPRGGVIDTEALIALRGPAAEIADAAGRTAASISAIERGGLVGALRARVDEASALFDTVSTMSRAVAQASELVPLMLGSEGPRDYLLLFQNNAEWRSLGGVPGAIALIHTEAGRMTLTQQTTPAALSDPGNPVAGLGTEARALFGDRPAQWMHSVTQVPDFAVAGQLAREYWTRAFGVPVDGVLAIDPVALSYLLTATGPLTLATGETLTDADAVAQLTGEVYTRYPDPLDQDAFFAGVTAGVFATLTEGAHADAVLPLLHALGRAAEENRLLVWSARPDEQAVLAGSTLQGALPESDEETTRFGVYVNDGTGSKMDSFMRLETAVAWCGAASDDGDASATVRVALRNEAPAGAGPGLPEYVTGGGQYGVAPGTTRTLVYVYLPLGATLTDARSDTASRFGGGFHEGRQVVTWSVDLGERMAATLDIDVLVPQTVDTEVRNTPILYQAETRQLGDPCL